MVAVALGLSLAGCGSGPRFYVGPTVPAASQEELKPRPDRGQLYLTVAARGSVANEYLATRAAAAALLRSGQFSEFVPSPEGVDQLAIVIVNKVGPGDLGGAFVGGMVTGLTYGAIGVRVKNRYVFTATYTSAAGELIRKEYRSAIYMTINRSGPKGSVEVSQGDAFEQMVEGFVLGLLRDLRAEQRL